MAKVKKSNTTKTTVRETQKKTTGEPAKSSRRKKKGTEIDLKMGNGKTYRIAGELRQWSCGPMVEDKDGKLVHKPEFFYSSLEGMLNGMAERAIRLSCASDFEELTREAKRIREEFKGYYDLSIGEGSHY